MGPTVWGSYSEDECEQAGELVEVIFNFSLPFPHLLCPAAPTQAVHKDAHSREPAFERARSECRYPRRDLRLFLKPPCAFRLVWRSRSSTLAPAGLHPILAGVVTVQHRMLTWRDRLIPGRAYQPHCAEGVSAEVCGASLSW
jgi:hypothetical protein